MSTEGEFNEIENTDRERPKMSYGRPTTWVSKEPLLVRGGAPTCVSCKHFSLSEGVAECGCVASGLYDAVTGKMHKITTCFKMRNDASLCSKYGQYFKAKD